MLHIDRIRYEAGRIAWLLHYQQNPPDFVDHADLDPMNNRIDNLRLATRKQNGQNRTKMITNTSGYKGVSPYPSRANLKCWRVAICTETGKKKHLEYFPLDKLEEAAECYRQAALKYHGDFARF